MSTLASVETGSFTPTELFAGDSFVRHNAYQVAADVVLVANSILAFDANGDLVEWDPTSETSTGKAMFVSCEAIDTTGAAATHPVYTGAFFNTDALAWPTGTTAAQKKLAFVNTNTDITHRSLGYSG